MIIWGILGQWKGLQVFSDLVVAYLFLGGTGAGCSLVSSLLALFSDADELDDVLSLRMRSSRGLLWKRFFSAMYLAALAALLLGTICLIADIGRPDRLLSMLFEPAPTYVAFGAWFIVLCMASSVFCLLLWAGIVPSTRRLMVAACVITAVTATAVVAYTGLLLSDVRAVPLWNTPWLVLLFALSALSCGIALMLLASFASRTMPAFVSALVGLAKVDAVIIVVEAIVGMFCLMSVWSAAGGPSGPSDSTDQAALASLHSLLAGPWAVLFWAGFAFIGLAVPFVHDVVIGRVGRSSASAVRSPASVLFVLGTAACVLVGGFVLRLIVVEAALHPAALLV